MKWRAFVVLVLSFLLVYAPVAPAASPAVVGTLNTKGKAAVNGAAVPAEVTLFAGDRISTREETAAGISLSGGDQVFLASLSTAQIIRADKKLSVTLEEGALAVVNRSTPPIVVTANGVRIEASGGSPAVYEVAVKGTSLKVMARKGTAVVTGSNRTVEVKEGTAMDATAPPQHGVSGVSSPLWTVVILGSAAAGVTGLALGLSAVKRAQPQNCVVVSVSKITCP